MANRAYLYSINKIPTSTKTLNTKIVGISEYTSDVPLSYKILLSSEPQIVQSIIFDGEVGIIGNYEKGVGHLKKYLDIFKKENVPNREKFDKYYEETFNFLNDSKNKQKYFQLEIGEILDMDPAGIEGLQTTLNEIKDWEQKLKNVPQSARLSIGPNADTIIAQMMADWEWQLGIDYWENNLYFNFSRENQAK